MPDEEFRAGAHDLETPFLFVPHGSPDPIEFKRKYSGWVSFPATFVPHPRPIPKWKIINGQRWPLDKRGRPWPKTRYGRPTCPFDELPPGMPAPGTQYELLRKFDHPTLFWEGEPTPTVEEVLAIGERSRAERAAAAPPPPIEPPRAYDGNGMGPARDYLTAMAGLDGAMRQATEDAAYWRATPSERMAMSDAVLDRNGAAALAATRKTGSLPSGAPEPLPFQGQETRATSLPSGVVLSDADPDPVLEGRQYAAAPFLLAPAAIELASAAATATLAALLGAGAVSVVLNETRKPPADATPRPAPVAVPPPNEGETLADVLKPGSQPVGEKGSDETIRELPGGEAAAEELFDRLSKGGVDVTPPGHLGRLVRMPDGTYRGYRSKSSDDNTPTIDIGVRGFGIRKLKFPGG